MCLFFKKNKTTGIIEYSSLPNRRGARNERGGGKDESFLISVVTVINMVVRIFRPVTPIKIRKKMN